MDRTIILMRHCEDRNLANAPDRLSSEGRKHAVRIANSITLNSDYYIVSSSALRCVETAEIISAQKRSVKQIDLLAEPEGLPYPPRSPWPNRRVWSNFVEMVSEFGSGSHLPSFGSENKILAVVHSGTIDAMIEAITGSANIEVVVDYGNCVVVRRPEKSPYHGWRLYCANVSLEKAIQITSDS